MASVSNTPSGILTANLADSAVTSAKIADGAVVNADVNASAAIAYAKLALTNSILNADIGSAAAIAYSKLALTGTIVNADVGASAAIAYSKLALGTSIVNADVSTSAAIAQSKIVQQARGTSIPGSPVNGDEYHYVADATNGIVWHFKYNSGSASTYKWEFCGGAPMYHEVQTSETRNNTAYGDLSTVGPTLTLPLAGDYLIAFGCTCYNDTAGGNTLVSPKLAGATAADADAVSAANSTLVASVTTVMTQSRQEIRTLSAASSVVKLQYRTTAGTATLYNRWVQITPVRVI